LGRAALQERERALTAFVSGWLSSIILIATFVVATSQSILALQIVAGVLLFALSLPAVVYGAVLMYRTSRLILTKWDLPKVAGKTLKTSMLRDPRAFDEWLAHQQSTYRS
jgi:hypothetical protein